MLTQDQITRFDSRGYYAGVRGDHCPRATSSDLRDGQTLADRDEARRIEREGFNRAWNEGR